MSVVIEIAGVLTDPEFQRMRHMALELREFASGVSVLIRSLLEVEFEPFLRAEGLLLEFPMHSVSSPIAFVPPSPSDLSASCGNTYIGDTNAFIEFCAMKYGLADNLSEDECTQLANEAWKTYRERSMHTFTYMRFAVDGEPMTPKDERVIFELFNDACPKACENFAKLCENGYAGLPVHRIVPGGWIQSGDVERDGRGDGAGGCVVNSDGVFEDETFCISHDKAGILSMANNGPHTNGAQFFITLGALPWLDKNKVAFGRVISGMKIIQAIGRLKVVYDRPIVPCIIAEAGQYV
ncbi:peptidyl-prolyl cis-trans isomerase, mitochondrial precursor [Thraustotheca clavata]|uniref:Peptidyl-prolyl cis-trans isomerase n=1 Tax=Thraustotheca clavata TaxID=74557 RepID=A0A1V9Y6U0_9STRA|nr:peptidyl-prolyl cis-trans isomerase, mitochondrial precursor [Thraustotheca clavata]